MRTKRVAHKKTRRSNVTQKQATASRPTKRARHLQDVEEEIPTKYSDEEWSKTRRKRLESMTFGTNEYLEWRILRAYGIDTQIKELINVGPWAEFFEISEPAYREITLEFLSTLQMTKNDMFFQANGRKYHVHSDLFGMYLRLYSRSESNTYEFRNLPTTWPGDMTAQRCWEELCEDEIRYNPAKSKASSIKNMNLRVAHHLLAHTIGGRKSSHGIVNSFEIFHLYSMAKKIKINVGLEVAKFIYRQASDPRAKGIYCGGYITKFLKGFNVFQIPQNDHGLQCTQISDGPFYIWGLEKVLNIPTPSRYSTPRRDTSTSKSVSDSDVKKLMKEIQEERKLNKKERLKNKKFRASVWKFLGRLASCFSPPPADLPTYESSPEPHSPELTDSEIPRRPGKEQAVEEISEEEEEDNEEQDESDDNEEEEESGSPGGSEDNEAAEDDDRST